MDNCKRTEIIVGAKAEAQEQHDASKNEGETQAQEQHDASENEGDTQAQEQHDADEDEGDTQAQGQDDADEGQTQAQAIQQSETTSLGSSEDSELDYGAGPAGPFFLLSELESQLEQDLSEHDSLQEPQPQNSNSVKTPTHAPSRITSPQGYNITWPQGSTRRAVAEALYKVAPMPNGFEDPLTYILGWWQGGMLTPDTSYRADDFRVADEEVRQLYADLCIDPTTATDLWILTIMACRVNELKNHFADPPMCKPRIPHAAAYIFLDKSLNETKFTAEQKEILPMLEINDTDDYGRFT